MKSKVILLPCTSYEEREVFEKIKKGFNLLGGLSSLIGKEEKVLVKPNLLRGADPKLAISTHPSVLGAVLRCLKEEGCLNVSYGDGPGVGASTKLTKVVELSGLDVEAEKYQVPLVDFEPPVEVSFPEGKVAKKFVLSKPILEADAIISVCKMKTHALETITGALKNQYGCVYRTSKGMGHAKYPDSKKFADMIADLNSFLKPRLFVMDGIVAMEGNGPASGDPVPMNVILISTDPVALDTVFAKLVYVNPEYVPTNVSGFAAGLGNMRNITVVTPDGELTLDEAQKKYGNPKFNVKRKKPMSLNFGERLKKLFGKTEKPVVDLEKCIACGICENACPVEGKAVHSGNEKKAEYDYDKCIRCYCCQEMCPVGAITKERG